MEMMQQPPEQEMPDRDDASTFTVEIRQDGVTLNGKPTDIRAALEAIVSAYEQAKLNGGDPFEAGLKDSSEPAPKPLPAAGARGW